MTNQTVTVEQAVADMLSKHDLNDSTIEAIVADLMESNVLRTSVSNGSRQVNDTELSIRQMLADGKTTGQIAKSMDISFQNARYYVLKITGRKGLKA